MIGDEDEGTASESAIALNSADRMPRGAARATVVMWTGRGDACVALHCRPSDVRDALRYGPCRRFHPPMRRRTPTARRH